MSRDESGKQLLARILDDPSDTNARLVYADWLLERGDRAASSFSSSAWRPTRAEPSAAVG